MIPPVGMTKGRVGFLVEIGAGIAGLIRIHRSILFAVGEVQVSMGQ